jgi:KaiC/GvpD/RAD55 family RecA-like ATPase
MIAAVIVDAEARDQYLRTIPADIMFGTGHALIWATLQQMQRKGLHYDPATLKQIGGDVDTQYVEGLIAQRPSSPPNIQHHVEMLRWDAARISTAQGPLTSFLELIKDPRVDPMALRSAARQIEAGLASGVNHSLRNPKQLVEEQMRVIRKRREGMSTFGFGIDGLDYYQAGETGILNGVLTDLEGHPRLVPGTAPGKITVVTGVSGSGKTTGVTRGVLGMYLAGRRVTYGAYEQGSGMSLELLAAFMLGMSREDLMTGAFDDGDERDLQDAMETISEHVVFDEMPYDNFDERKAKFQNQRSMDRIAQSIADSRCDVYIADLFRRTMGETDPSDEERALNRMQEMASRMNVHIILVQQQKLKEVEASKRKLPTRDLIKGSSAWVEVADQIVAFHRPALWKNVPDDTLYSLVLKQRYGKWPMMIEHRWDPVFGRIEGGKMIDMQFGNDESTDESEAGDPFWGKRKGK